MKLLTLLILVVTGMAAAAQEIPTNLETLSNRAGQSLTVRVEGAPAAALAARCDLGQSLTGLELRPDGEGAWTGSFALLPNMVHGTVRPEIHLLDEQQHDLPVGKGSGVSVEMASSDLDQEGLALLMADRETVFVFDDTVKTSSIQLATRDGWATPELSGNTFVLPLGVAAINVSAIVAQASDGTNLVFSPDWTSDDVATVEEEL